MTGKTALITGGSRGLGRDMALRLVKAGADVIITYNFNKHLAEQVCAELQGLGRRAAALPYHADKPETWEVFGQSVARTLEEQFSKNRLDCLILNAGIGATVMIPAVTADFFDQMVNIHFKSVFFTVQRLLPVMEDGGRIVTVSSGSTRTHVPGYSVYAAAKGAVEVFTRYLAKECGSRGITVNCVAPGAIETDFNNAAIRSNPERKAFIAAQTPLGRVGAADDIGGVVLFLCGEDSKWINGQRIEVSGGIAL